MPSIETGGGRIDYTVYGDGRAASSVVLLAGFTAPATSWRYQIPSLIQAGHRVIGVDLPGHGPAPDLPHGTTMQTRAGHLHALMEELDLQGAVLIGGSTGGNTIWSYVDAHGTGRLAAAVVVDQTPRMLNTPDWTYGFYGYDGDTVDTFFADVIPATGHGTPIWKRGMRLVRLLAAMGRVDRTLSPPELALLNDHAKRDWRPTIRSSDLPVLFVAGSESEFWPSAHAAAAAALAPNGASTVVPRAGHATNMERPDSVNKAVAEFLDSAV
ncbi:alpha/beta fold hydrolase [Rhodococcus jostii]|uniref:Pimeloyl-ACP methyl ester carboxylesterase n=1 Tax=Rhodococcus jostii TaxID=132919 RepID=A0A1H5ML07_RHOJO|nr:alpha/beta hydrolase [Rhodococcus jostii]SEE89820.1 Pimeloyl-ACP methyl ester carboxylesterase [Rhodococcus jostii]